jgi:hypothetical protein
MLHTDDLFTRNQKRTYRVPHGLSPKSLYSPFVLVKVESKRGLREFSLQHDGKQLTLSQIYELQREYWRQRAAWANLIAKLCYKVIATFLAFKMLQVARLVISSCHRSLHSYCNGQTKGRRTYGHLRSKFIVLHPRMETLRTRNASEALHRGAV